MKKNKTSALLLCIFLGYLGVHRFYVGKKKTGLLYLFTVGLCGIGWIADIINIANNVFTDGNGNYLSISATENQILNENKKMPIQRKWQFWVGVVIVFVIFLAVPNKENKTQLDTDNLDTSISDVGTDTEENTDTATEAKSNIEADSTDIIIDEKTDKVEEETESTKERELKTEKVNLCSDTDGEIFSIVLDSDKGVYHLKENCNKMIFTTEQDKIYYLITANYINDVDEYLESNGYTHCTKCVKIEEKITTDTNTNEDVTSSTQSVTSTIQTSQDYLFIINTDTLKYHYSSCHVGQKITDNHRLEYTVTATSISEAEQFLQQQGYSPCGVCFD